uniref:Uncharacterized protein n=1 Tax=Romanomermis culicivorax TaxID=13658 RepID=A0A915JYA9_ROMCU
MGKKSKRNRDRISDNEEEARSSKKLKLEVADVINFDEDYEIFLIKKPLSIDINLLRNSNVTTADSSPLILVS